MRHAHGNCDAYSGSHSDSNTNSYIYSNADGYGDCHSYSDSYHNSNCKPHCYSYSHGETFSYAKTRRNAQAAPHSTTAPVTFVNEKETHCSIRKSDL
jgi:hypothetical protein